MNRLRTFWLTVRDSLWFIPAAMVGGGVALALVLVDAQGLGDSTLAERWPRMFGAGAEGARSMLGAIATSMITVAGVVFSITIVSLSLAATQYSPRVLRNFMSDRPTQVVLGTFVSVFAYCLIVLRTIRGSDRGDFVPSLAVLVGVLLALFAVALLIYFIHHVASAIQVSSIVDRIADETAASIERLFPSDVGQPAQSAKASRPATSQGHHRSLIARDSGYLVAVDSDSLLETATEEQVFIEVIPQVGDFVLRGEPLCRVFPVDADDGTASRNLQAMRGSFTLQAERTVHQDVAHGLEQLVDVALRALSPSVHDPRTAIACIHRLGVLLAMLAARAMPAPARMVDGQLRLVLPAPRFEALLKLAFDPLVRNMASHAEVYAESIRMLLRIGAFTSDPRRRQALARQLDALGVALATADLSQQAREELHAMISRSSRRLATPSSGQAPL